MNLTKLPFFHMIPPDHHPALRTALPFSYARHPQPQIPYLWPSRACVNAVAHPSKQDL